MSLRWNGDDVKRKVERAARIGIDKTMAQAVVHAKRNHPGWKNRTGLAEGSVRIIQQAERRGSGQIVGVWGSTGVNYVIWLELKQGSFLRSAGDAVYPKLKENIKRAL